MRAPLRPGSAGYHAIIVGAGPNGLAAAVTLAEKGWRVQVLEANDHIGGGAHTAELTLPGFRHDVCSAIHPMGAASPFFRTLPLAQHGLEWIEPPVQLAHPLDGGAAVCLHRSLDDTAAGLGADGGAYARLLAPLIASADGLLGEILRPLRWPGRPLLLARFGLTGMRSAAAVSRRFRGDAARALFAGIAAHSGLPLERAPTAAIALALMVPGHTVGWPFPRGGAGRITEALAGYLRSLGGEIETGRRVETLDEVESAAKVVLLDLTPRQVRRLAGERLPSLYRRQLQRYRYGPGAFKLDFALDAPIPWAADACREAATVHLGGTFEEIAAAEASVWRGEHPERPFVLLAQPSLFDTRAPAGKHTAWAYCHVPLGSTVDMTDRIEAQIERFAPGFRARILARHAMATVDLERHNANLVGGDINGGTQGLWQIVARPALRWDPYATPLPGVFLCSASTPPGGGVHGMCGHLAALSAWKRST